MYSEKIKSLLKSLYIPHLFVQDFKYRSFINNVIFYFILFIFNLQKLPQLIKVYVTRIILLYFKILCDQCNFHLLLKNRKF